MRNKIRTQLSVLFIGIALGALIIAGLVIIFETRHNLALFHKKIVEYLENPRVDFYLEKDIVESIVWITVDVSVLAIVASLYIANRLSVPLADMREIAEQMKQGHLDQRIQVKGSYEIMDLAKSLNELAEQLQNQERLRKIMTADIAHELKTPLSTLKTHMEALEDGVWEPTYDRFHACYEEIERLINLVSDLDQLSFMESPKFVLRCSNVDLSIMVSQCMEMVHSSYQKKGVVLKFVASSPIWVWADRERIIQILNNLLSNALKFTPAGGEVNIQIIVKEHEALVTVSDTGIGISRDDLPYVFERFFRVDKSRNRKSGGGGIGLTIVKRLVEAHCGQAWIDSEEGKGTRVFVQLPKHFDNNI